MSILRSLFAGLRRRSIVRASGGVGGLLVLTLLLTLSMPAIERQLNRWSVLPRPQALIELAVSEPHSLAKTYRPGSTQSTSFTIGNRTGAAATYHYIITENDAANRHTTLLAGGSLTVTAADSRMITAAITPANLGARVYIRIALSNGPEVGYWLQRQ